MTKPDWRRIREILVNMVDNSSVNVPDEDALKQLVTLYGWEALGAITDTLMDEARIHSLTAAGVPFEVAAKMMGMRPA